MSLQGLMSGTNPLLIMAAALLYFLFLYIRRGTGSDHSEHQATPVHGSNEIVHRSEEGAAVSHRSTGHDNTHAVRHNHTTIAAAATQAATATAAATHAAAGYDFTDDTLRRHNTSTRNDRDGAVVGGAAAGRSDHHASGHHSAGHHAATSSSAGDLHTPHVPAEYTFNEGSAGGSWRFPVIAALCASLVSCQIASKDGIAGIPGNIASLFGGSSGAPVIAKIEAQVPDAAQLKAKASEVKAEVKAIATEAVATAKAKVAEVTEKVVEAAAPAKPVSKVEVQPEVKAAPVAPAVLGVTHFYGQTASTSAAAFNAAAKMNADYAAALAAPVKVAAAPAPAPVPAPAAPEPAPVSLGGVGQTSFFGIAEKPDATFPWAASATVFKVAAPEPAPAPAPVAAVPEPAPVSLGGVGQTSYFGIAEKPDATFPWAAAATVYKVAAPEPAPAPAPVAPAPERAAPEKAPVSLGGVGQTSFFGIAEKPDATFPWAAAATVFKAAAPPPAPAPVTPAAVNTCRDQLNAEAKAGKINFATSSFEILPDSFPTLDKLAKLAKDCGGVLIDVGGHTDSTGKAASNKSLSELRAKAVVRYLTGAGVDAGKLKATGYGQDRPVADNATDAGKRQNRRIEFIVSAP